MKFSLKIINKIMKIYKVLILIFIGNLFYIIIKFQEIKYNLTDKLEIN